MKMVQSFVAALVISLSFVAIVTNGQVAINTSPPNATIEVGRNLTIICSGGGASATVSLQINGDANSNARVIDTTPDQLGTKTFLFTDVNLNDEGTLFSCAIVSVSQSTDGMPLIVLHGPTITNIMDGAGYEGETAIGTFSVASNPPVTSDDITIMPDRQPAPIISVNGSSVSVTFETLERSDADSYTVTVTNDAINSTESITLNIDVYYGPTFANVQNLVSATAGESVTFDCVVSESNPSVQSITLTVPGLTNNLDITANPEYTVDAISADFNETVYTCTADNGERTTSQNHTLIVLPNPTTTVSSTSTPTSSVTPSSTPGNGAGRLGIFSFFVLLIIGLLSMLFAQ